MAIQIDLRNYKDRQGSRVPEGTYTLRLVEIEEDTSANGNPMLLAYFEIVGGDYDGMTLVDRLTLTDKAMFRVVAFLNGFGIKTPRKKIAFDPDRVLNRKVQAEVVDNEYNGRTNSQISSYIRIGKPTADEVEEDLEDEVEEAPAPAKKSKKAEPVAETSDDDDLDLDDLDL